MSQLCYHGTNYFSLFSMILSYASVYVTNRCYIVMDLECGQIWLVHHVIGCFWKKLSQIQLLDDNFLNMSNCV